MKGKKSNSLLVGILCLLLASCQGITAAPMQEATPGVGASTPPTSEPAGRLVASSWKWVSFTNPVESFSVEMPQVYTVAFNPDGTLNIVADCNRAKGTYALDGSSLKIEIGPTTMAVCAQGSRSEQFVQYLGFSAIYFFKGENLLIDLIADAGTLKLAPNDQ